MKTTLRRRPKLVTWRCPKCGYVTQQRRNIKASMHACGLGQRLVYLVRQDDDD